MYVYNVGQANCILVTVDTDYGKNAIFFDTGVQNVADFNTEKEKLSYQGAYRVHH
ncbi:MAG: hypothetical protein LBI37_01420 [Puniceicoccales bacterium]|nr:hypothetical protein [Puniceicoccales bacterium]